MAETYPEFFGILERSHPERDIQYEYGVGFGYGLQNLLEGKVDAILNNSGGTWDVAAPAAIVEALGGISGSIRYPSFEQNGSDLEIAKLGGFFAARAGLLRAV